jgi:hypothetical protein
MACAGCCDVEGIFRISSRSPRAKMQSVKVPPASIAIRNIRAARLSYRRVDLPTIFSI